MKAPQPPTYEQALAWVEEEYRKSLSTNRVSKELLVAQTLIVKIHELQTKLQKPVDSIIEVK